jgi:hypothetical protein
MLGRISLSVPLVMLLFAETNCFTFQSVNNVGCQRRASIQSWNRPVNALNAKRCVLARKSSSILATRMMFSAENIFQYENLFVLPFWFMMLVAPNNKVSKFNHKCTIPYHAINSLFSDHQTNHEQLCFICATGGSVYMAPCGWVD